MPPSFSRGTSLFARNNQCSFCSGLWDDYRLRRNVTRRNFTHTDTTFAAGNSLDKRLNFMEVTAELKASFVGGLVEVGGSARFLSPRHIPMWRLC